MEKRSSIKAFRARNGFTLIELLVVVLIIGILAAVALPQYNKAIKKTHMAEALTIMDANSKDAQAYLLEHGELAKWAAMITSYADQLEIETFRSKLQIGYDTYEYDDGRFGGNFGTYFQIGCGDPSPSDSDKDVFYCIRPKNGDKAYIFHWISNLGKEERICLGTDCGQYIGSTNGTCSFEEQPWSSAGCDKGGVAREYGCRF